MIDSTTWYGLGGVALAWFLRKWLFPPASDLSHIPTIGYSTPILSLWSTIKALTQSDAMVAEGYYKYKDRAFKIPDLFRWHVIVSGRQMIEDLRKAPDDVFNFEEANADILSIEYTLGLAVKERPYHNTSVRSSLTRNLGVLFPEVREELEAAFDEAIPPTDDWVSLPAMDTLRQIVCRTSNRIFVGLPLCRNRDFQGINMRFATDVVVAALTLQLFPRFLKPLVVRLLTNLPSSHARAQRHLEPILLERLQKSQEYGLDYPDKPNDMISWLIDDASEGDRNVSDLTTRVLTINFAAIHTSSMTFGQVLYVLAAYPENAKPMREEVERVIKEKGWTKVALAEMRKVDSFIREVMRHHPLDAALMTRKILKDTTLADGTYIPAGTFISAASGPTHHDEELYDQPDTFNPWRFSEMRTQVGESLKHQMVSTGREFMSFGYGKHACPGRFFAANELKAMMAHLVLTYDVKLEKEGVVPESFKFGVHCLPNPTAKVMFRRRQD